MRKSPLNLRDCQWLCVCFLRDGVSVWAHVKPASFILEKVAVEKEPEKILGRKDTSGCYPLVCIATAKPPRIAYGSSSSEVVCFFLSCIHLDLLGVKLITVLTPNI